MKVSMATHVRLLTSALALGFCTPAYAEPPSSSSDVPSSKVSPADLIDVVPAGTLVAIRVDQNLSSKTAKRGDKFPISLMNDLWVSNKIAVPVGTKGIGEVVHASGKGFGGRAGELIVTARYLEHEGRKIRLGHFKLSAAGANNATAAFLATTAAPIIGVFVTGTSAYIGLGQLAQAKLAEDFPLEIQPNLTTAAESPANQGGNK